MIKKHLRLIECKLDEGYEMKHKVTYWLYLSAGSLFILLGFIGVFLPVLPTTPFLLLASYCFIRSSKKAHGWLLNHPVLGVYLTNYIEHKGIRKRDRNVVLTCLLGVLTLSMLSSSILHLRLFLLVVGVGVTIHLMTLKVIEEH